MPELREECGVFGVFHGRKSHVAEDCYYGLSALQHRGQESCGIAVNEDGLFRLHTDAGLVSEVMTPRVLELLGQGDMAIGHVRYGTDATSRRSNLQPIVVDHRKGRMALANNGSLVNYSELRTSFENQGFIFHTTGDAEIISCVITRERLTAESTEEAVARAMPYLKGSYTLVIMSPQKLIAVRGPMGVRPLCYGRLADGGYAVASESCALDAVGAELVRDVRPGEIIVFDRGGVRTMGAVSEIGKKSICVFEYIYFARPDSVLDGVSVHQARARAGEILAKLHPVEADIVVGVPDSGIDGAMGYARQSGTPYGLGFVKNRYIGRTFIAPGSGVRRSAVHIKLNPVASVVRGKRVVLVDDSIVRGTTSGKIVRLLREAGALQVHMRVTSPPFLHPCYYGTDIKSRDDLIACKYSIDEIRSIIGADSLGYLSLEGARSMAAPIPPCDFCTSCFDGQYPTEIPASTERDRYARRLVRVGEETA
ncbi:MAG: amidophosphoribosyltransferase [Christensenellales bacterium]|jgi:amidophosphoribosyltransferase